MKNISSETGFINTSLSPAMNFPSRLSRAEEIAVCSALLLDAMLIVTGNLFTIVLFALKKRIRKKSLFLVINMAFADGMLGAVSLPVYAYLRVGFPHLWSMTEDVWAKLGFFYLHFDLIFLQASLISAVFISCERYYAVNWPLKHRTLSTRAYAIVIAIIWTLAVLASEVHILIANLYSNEAGYYVSTILFSIFLFILCGCNIGIWRKFQKRNNALQQQNRASQRNRLTKTLLFVSLVAVLSWLPYVIVDHLLIGVREVIVPLTVYYPVTILNYSNSLVNPVIYAFKIPEYRQAIKCCSKRRTLDELSSEDTERGNNRTAASDLTLLPATDPRHLQLAFAQEVMDTKL